MDFSRLLEFAGNHTLLITAFFAVLGLLVAGELRNRLGGIRKVDPTGAAVLSNRENAVFLDIREDKEYHEGHIPDALHIPLKQLPDRIAELEKYRDRPLIVCCRSGSRSASACATLRKQGFENVYNLGGGMLAWQSANLPVRKK
ncbi:MAG TPA: rhodanese-like domain-containing protein [Gammaproteobacteria bacterium]|nr:rhodanese-like domain-containing protein [Gammaproteobacteria bacterium]